MQSHPLHKVINSHCFFVLELLKKHIQGYDGASPAYSSAGTQDKAKDQLVYRSGGRFQLYLKVSVYSGFS